jgi:hypothetical protein
MKRGHANGSTPSKETSRDGHVTFVGTTSAGSILCGCEWVFFTKGGFAADAIQSYILQCCTCQVQLSAPHAEREREREARLPIQFSITCTDTCVYFLTGIRSSNLRDVPLNILSAP